MCSKPFILAKQRRPRLRTARAMFRLSLCHSWLSQNPKLQSTRQTTDNLTQGVQCWSCRICFLSSIVFLSCSFGKNIVRANANVTIPRQRQWGQFSASERRVTAGQRSSDISANPPHPLHSLDRHAAAVAHVVACARPATPGAWPKQRRTWSIMSFRRYRCGIGCWRSQSAALLPSARQGLQCSVLRIFLAC